MYYVLSDDNTLSKQFNNSKQAKTYFKFIAHTPCILVHVKRSKTVKNIDCLGFGVCQVAQTYDNILLKSKTWKQLYN